MRIESTILMLLLLALSPGQAAAQRASLDQAQAALKTGATGQARALLEQWQKENAAAARSSADDARATFLAARLATNAAAAEDAYLTVALSHPTSAYAAESLLRLGQARLTSGDPGQAMVYLQRLSVDYPRSELRASGLLWLARAQLASGRRELACTTVKTALQLSSADAETLLRGEEAVACISPANAPTAVAAKPVAAPQPEVAGRFAIQVGAFRERSGARSVARQLEQAGFAAVRLVTVPDNSLIRVRVGTYESSAAAQRTVSKLKAAGFTAVIVADRKREKPIQE